MVEKNKNTALLVLGAIAVVAIVGLVMMFADGNKATGEIVGYGAYPKIYGGAVKQVQFPNYADRGTPWTYTPEDQGLAIGKTPSVGAQGMQPPSYTNWPPVGGDKNPAQTVGYYWGATPQSLINLNVKTYEWLNSQYRSIRVGDQYVREKTWDCGQDPNLGTYYCNARTSGSN